MTTCCTQPTCTQMLCDLMTAYTRLIAGMGVQTVKFGDDETRYQPGDIPELKKTLVRLHQTCGTPESAALLGMQSRRAPAGVCYGDSYPCRTRGC